MKFTLPKLEFAYDALEPAIDAKTMEVHYEKHHQGYLDKLNSALGDIETKEKPIEEILSDLNKIPEAVRTSVRNNGGGFYNHCLFWSCLSPESDRNHNGPVKDLAAAIDSSFTNFNEFKKNFEATALGQFGSGWAWLCFRDDGALEINSTANQDSPLMGSFIGLAEATPIFGVDVWEHAYYLHYQNRRAEYLNAIWSVVNWGKIAENFQRAQASQSLRKR